MGRLRTREINFGSLAEFQNTLPAISERMSAAEAAYATASILGLAGGLQFTIIIAGLDVAVGRKVIMYTHSRSQVQDSGKKQTLAARGRPKPRD